MNTSCIICGCCKIHDEYKEKICHCDSCKNYDCIFINAIISENDIIRKNIMSFLEEEEIIIYDNIYNIAFNKAFNNRYNINKLIIEFDEQIKINKNIKVLNIKIVNGEINYLIKTRHDTDIYCNCECKNLTHSVYNFNDRSMIIYGDDETILWALSDDEYHGRSYLFQNLSLYNSIIRAHDNIIIDYSDCLLT
tara:strand:- start:293 stop:871 length:579 start_codon:yes stop_codon:yes gene_type:complete